MRAAYCSTMILVCNMLAAASTLADDSSNGSPGMQPPVPELPGRGMESAQEKITDTWITAKVKSLFVYSKDVSAHVINVETSDGIVILSGSVEMDSTRDVAVELAQSVRGVRRVNSNDLLVRGSRNPSQGDSDGAAH